MKKQFLFSAWLPILILGWITCFHARVLSAQDYLLRPTPAATAWADSVLKNLTPDQRIAQLMVMRLSSLDAKTRKPVYFEKNINQLIDQYGIGGVCLFQGHPYATGSLLNRLQQRSPVPLLVCVDGEWGLGMRLYDSIMPLPRQMMLGAVQDTSIISAYASRIAEQCRRLGIHVNYAPVIDINNNPANPVINDRSFGEQRDRVAQYGLLYIKGLEAAGIMSCAKHFPGHGDVNVDSHYDLPVIKKTLAQLDSLELFPFREAIAAGVGSVMIAHLFIPELDPTPNRATSISRNAIQVLLREKLGYQGITFTDALEMQGVKKFFPNGEAAVQSLIAGNDMLCLPEDVPAAIKRIKQAIKKKQGLTWEDIDTRCRRVLLAKYHYIGPKAAPVVLENLTVDLNAGLANLRERIAEKALTILNIENTWESLDENIPLRKIAYVALGLSSDNAMTRALRQAQQADIYFFNYKQDAGRIPSLVALLQKRYTQVIVGVHGLSRSPAQQFGLSDPAKKCASEFAANPNNLLLLFGNPYALAHLPTFSSTAVCYDDDTLTQKAAYRWLNGQFHAEGRLPVTASASYPAGSGVDATLSRILRTAAPAEVGINDTALQQLDSITTEALRIQATPGCVILAARHGRVFWHKAYGFLDETKTQAVTTKTWYDLASITKIAATTIAIMKLDELGKIQLSDSVGTYITEARGTPVGRIQLEKLLLHEAGLPPFIRFHEAYLDQSGKPNPNIFLTEPSPGFVRVTPQLYLPSHYIDSAFRRIYLTPLVQPGKYVYSDLDFLLLGRIIERVTGAPLDEWVQRTIYAPLRIKSLRFNPTISPAQIAPTEREQTYRQTLLRGTVHDPTAALFGGVAGHAGLFGTAEDLAILMQMLLNGGTYAGVALLKPATIDRYTAYNSLISRRGLGFDKPERDNSSRNEPYPCRSASPETFGHTGFTGTCAWADPRSGILFIFLSNRVHPNGGEQKQLLQANVRPRLHETLYQAIQSKATR